MFEPLNVSFQAVSEWSDANLVMFNASKTQACLFSAKPSLFDLTPTFRGVSITLTDRLQFLGISLTPTLSFGTYIESLAQVAAKKLCVLAKVREYFTSEQLLNLYQAQVRSCIEYCSHLWDGSAKYQLEALESIEKRARKLVGNDRLFYARLQNLEHRRKVVGLTVFYRIHFGSVP
ncbi:hypothetical protein K1T71_003807 [Dendrolimus kikuchii]|uniref:Uncharacterized protein n=1 Tax=Dendrolimus kikuchii TaxID=765133 RepID=A0ACC1D9Y1_9NEOP|nr:hypothetical protein K1T71_003807 [Dendrolimus kikuchii]